MGDENPIRTLGDYSKPSHEGYRNTIELPVGNNVVVRCRCKITLMEMETDDIHLGGNFGRPTAQINFMFTDYHTKEELRSKGIKSPSKLLSSKYLSQSSVIEQNKNPLSPKRVYFVNSIVILNKENEAEEEGSVEPNKTEYINRKNANETDEEVESEKEVKEETEGETKEEEEDDPKHFDTFPTMKDLRYHE
ncbi:hypothetical protein Tco_1023701 [Tanacetum coccineum]